jgi:hypothetical protein
MFYDHQFGTPILGEDTSQIAFAPAKMLAMEEEAECDLLRGRRLLL